MKIAAIYDIHGNLPALNAVLDEIDSARPDLILVGGDVASGPMPGATLERLMELGERARFVRGNADRELVDCFDGSRPNFEEETRWVTAQLERRQRDFLASFSERVVLAVDGLGEVLFCHGSPRSDEELITAATSEERLRAALTGVEQKVVVCGHTHTQFDRILRGVRIVNAGSVGMPYGEPGAYWLLLGPSIILRRTLYDLEQAAELVRACGYPQAQDFADNNVLKPPTEAEAIEVFEQMAARHIL